MKKHLLLTLLLATAILSQAQVYDSICAHVVGDVSDSITSVSFKNLMETRSGDILARVALGARHNNSLQDWGNRIYRLTFLNGDLTIEDSLFIEDHDLQWDLMEKEPFGSGNIYAKIVCDYDSCRSSLRVSFFNDELDFDYGREFWIPLEDTIIRHCSGYAIDPYGDIVFHYIKSGRHQYFVKVGLDGTIKQRAVYSDSIMEMPMSCTISILRTSPLEYAFDYYTYIHTQTTGYYQHRCFILDSVFNLNGCVSFDNSNPTTNNFLDPSGFDKALGLDDGDIVIATTYGISKFNPTSVSVGAAICKFDRENNMLDYKLFEADPMITNGSVTIGTATPIGLNRAPGGNIYFAYNTQQTTDARVAVVKMDPDLNILWQRYFLPPNCYWGQQMILLDGGGLALGGFIRYSIQPSVFFLALTDDGVSVPEMEAYVRPYAFYPNPVGDILHMEFSPDVKPVQVELYDLQGRLLRTQCNSFESINMDNLPTGTYTLRVTLDDGMSYGDKVVKQ